MEDQIFGCHNTTHKVTVKEHMLEAKKHKMRQPKTRGTGTDNKTASKEFIQLKWSRWERKASCKMPVWEWSKVTSAEALQGLPGCIW